MTFPDSLWVGIPAPTSSGDAPGGLQLPREASSSRGGCQSLAPPLLGSSLTLGSCFQPLPEFSLSGTPVGRRTEVVTPTALRAPGSSGRFSSGVGGGAWSVRRGWPTAVRGWGFQVHRTT